MLQNSILKKVTDSPLLVRVVPLVIYLGLTFCQGKFGEASRYWFYLAKTIIGAWMIWSWRPCIPEMRWSFSWEAVLVGAGVFVVWIGLDPYYPKIGSPPPPWNPLEYFAHRRPLNGTNDGEALAWFFVVARLAGSTFVVPPLEEVFYRSFLYRYITRVDFLNVPLGQFRWQAFLVAAVIFGFGHREWLAGILCGMAYQWLVCAKQRLGDAMTAHAITNFLLGLWVAGKGAWHFW